MIPYFLFFVLLLQSPFLSYLLLVYQPNKRVSYRNLGSKRVTREVDLLLSLFPSSSKLPLRREITRRWTATMNFSSLLNHDEPNAAPESTTEPQPSTRMSFDYLNSEQNMTPAGGSPAFFSTPSEFIGDSDGEGTAYTGTNEGLMADHQFPIDATAFMGSQDLYQHPQNTIQPPVYPHFPQYPQYPQYHPFPHSSLPPQTSTSPHQALPPYAFSPFQHSQQAVSHLPIPPPTFSTTEAASEADDEKPQKSAKPKGKGKVKGKAKGDVDGQAEGSDMSSAVKVCIRLALESEFRSPSRSPIAFCRSNIQTERSKQIETECSPCGFQSLFASAFPRSFYAFERSAFRLAGTRRPRGTEITRQASQDRIR